jgi:hypothetical protein
MLAHASPLADYKSQVVPPSPSVPRRWRRHDHSLGVVINPPQPQPEVVVDLVSDNEYLAAARPLAKRNCIVVSFFFIVNFL